MGWLGKSTMLLAPGLGPWVLLGVVATDLAIEPDPPLKKTCGACERCIVACPTGAISPEGYVLDARLCISYHTIENRGLIPRDLRPKFRDWVFGCDDCLTSCPVGRRANASHPDLVPATADGAFPVLAELLDMDEASFVERFRGRAIMRAKRDGMARNACVALGNVGTEADLPVLYTALHDQSALVRGHAAWAISALARRLGVDRAAARATLTAALEDEPDASVREELEWAIANAEPGD
jgi:epoxyqueuosine reductase